MKKQVSLYIHIPFCLSKCDYCDFFSVVNDNACTVKNCGTSVPGIPVPQQYVDSVCEEIKFRIKEYGCCELKSVYVGGGTPSLLTPVQINQLGSEIAKLDKSDNFEFTFEINPDDVTLQLIDSLAASGVNRLSCGIQSFSQKVLENINRRANAVQVNNALELLCSNWKKKLSIDLICGLPFETEETMLEGLKKLCSLKIPHISFYSLCVEEETPLGNAIINNKIKYDYDFSDDLWIKGRDFLLQNGYEQYEISNFCLPGYECIHNMTYWSHGDYIGVGSGATGTVYEKNGNGLRWTNIKNIKNYIKFWKSGDKTLEIPQDVEKIGHQVSKFEYFMMGLRTKRGISTTEYKNIFGDDIPQKVQIILEKWCSLGKCKSITEPNGKRYCLNSEGMLFLNNLLEELC